MKVNVYVDGFNLYYGALRNTAGSKWLDLGALARFLLGKHEVQHIRYFTAKVRAMPHDPQQPQRQQAYLRALDTIPNLTIHYGHFACHPDVRRLTRPLADGTSEVEVYLTSEKGSDVNLASYLLLDAQACDVDAVAIITNDSDLCTPIAMARDFFKRFVFVFDPNQRQQMSRQLADVATSYRRLRPSAFTANQFPPLLTDDHGTITCPAGWGAPRSAATVVASASAAPVVAVAPASAAPVVAVAPVVASAGPPDDD